MDKDTLIKWYIDNGIEDIIEEKSYNHKNNICVPHETIISSKKVILEKETKDVNERIEVEVKEVAEVKADCTKSESRQEFNFNYIYQSLANKYRNDNMKMIKENTGTVEDFIKKSRELADNANTIDALRSAVENFDGYLDIKKLATNTVFGEGNPNADIMILGEAPGNNEDIEGRPFCGQSGELLDNMFESIGIKRKDLYITNTLFWRPPGNRTPTPEEIAICRPFVEKHIALINPKIIIFMGATALNSLVNTNLTITKARRQLFDYTNQYLGEKVIKTTPLFHPSYLLRQANKKKDAWGDMLFVQNLLNS